MMAKNLTGNPHMPVEVSPAPFVEPLGSDASVPLPQDSHARTRVPVPAAGGSTVTATNRTDRTADQQREKPYTQSM
jgi:hypothetical protein